MNKCYLLFFFLFLPFFSGSATPRQERLPLPSVIRNPDKQNPELLRLQKLLDNGQLILFYRGPTKCGKKPNATGRRTLRPRN